MRLPIRRGERERRKAVDHHLTPEAIARLKRELEDLEKRALPAASAEMRRTAEMGDLSENAAYQHAKDTVRRMNNRILILKDRVHNAIPISGKTSGVIDIGSLVTLRVADKTVRYEILGPQEANPGKGKISFVSPLGAALLHHRKGERIILKTKTQSTEYEIVDVE